MKRLLNILSSMDVGGAETMLMKFYRQLDKSKYQMDFLLMSERKSFYEEEILSLGGKIFHVCPKSKKPVTCFLKIKSIVKRNNYKYVMRSGDNAAGVLDLLAAKSGGARILVFNSTNSKTYGDSIREKIIHYLFFPLAKRVPTLKIGCSISANDFMFGKKSTIKKKSIVFHNALNIKNYNFDESWRKDIRNELHIPDGALVIGNVSRLSRQKNHKFLLSVFCEIQKMDKNSYLVLIGEGELKKDIINEAKENGLLNNLILTGLRTDINKCLAAFDVFAFPSLYEGLPNAVVEAQAAGLPCVLSNTITNEIKLCENVIFLPINEKDVHKWAIEILSIARKRNKHAESDLEKSGYSIENTTTQLTNLIFENKSFN